MNTTTPTRTLKPLTMALVLRAQYRMDVRRAHRMTGRATRLERRYDLTGRAVHLLDAIAADEAATRARNRARAHLTLCMGMGDYPRAR